MVSTSTEERTSDELSSCLSQSQAVEEAVQCLESVEYLLKYQLKSINSQATVSSTAGHLLQNTKLVKSRLSSSLSKAAYTAARTLGKTSGKQFIVERIGAQTAEDALVDPAIRFDVLNNELQTEQNRRTELETRNEELLAKLSAAEERVKELEEEWVRSAEEYQLPLSIGSDIHQQKQLPSDPTPRGGPISRGDGSAGNEDQADPPAGEEFQLPLSIGSDTQQHEQLPRDRAQQPNELRLHNVVTYQQRSRDPTPRDDKGAAEETNTQLPSTNNVYDEGDAERQDPPVAADEENTQPPSNNDGSIYDERNPERHDPPASDQSTAASEEGIGSTRRDNTHRQPTTSDDSTTDNDGEGAADNEINDNNVISSQEGLHPTNDDESAIREGDLPEDDSVVDPTTDEEDNESTSTTSSVNTTQSVRTTESQDIQNDDYTSSGSGSSDSSLGLPPVNNEREGDDASIGTLESIRNDDDADGSAEIGQQDSTSSSEHNDEQYGASNKEYTEGVNNFRKWKQAEIKTFQKKHPGKPMGELEVENYRRDRKPSKFRVRNFDAHKFIEDYIEKKDYPKSGPLYDELKNLFEGTKYYSKIQKLCKFSLKLR